MRKIIEFIGKYFVVIGGLGFIFGIGALYGMLKVDSILIHIIFLLIGIGWIVFLIKYFWDMMEKK